MEENDSNNLSSYLSFCPFSNLSSWQNTVYDVGPDFEKSSLNKLSASLENLLIGSEYDYSDAEVEVEGISVGVYRGILAARSPFFHEVFKNKNGNEEGPVKKEGNYIKPKYNLSELVPHGKIGYEAFMDVLSYMYTGRVNAPPPEVSTCVDESCPHDVCVPAISYAVELMYACATFQIEELVMIVERRLLYFVDKAFPEEVYPILLVAYHFKLDQLLSHCVQTIARLDLDDVLIEKLCAPELVADIRSARKKSNYEEEHDLSQINLMNYLNGKTMRRILRALDSNDVELVKLLLNESKMTLDDTYALHYAAGCCSPKIFDEVYSLGNANLNLWNARGYTVLHIAARKKDPSILLRALEHGASVFDVTRDGRIAVTIRRRMTRPKDFNEVKEHGKETNMDRLCIDVLEREMRGNPLAGDVSMCSVMMAGAETDIFQPRNNLYTHAENSHLFLTRLIISTFDSIFLLFRALYLAMLFTPCVAMAPFADSFGPEFRKLWLQVVHQTLERAGPAFIKWGQWAATRPDLFPRDLCAELSKLHTQAPRHSFAYTKMTIEKSFGRKISEIFDDFQEEPIASGSIAQVHRASLRAQGGDRKAKPMVVAVKVRHPGVGKLIKTDFEIINVMARMSKYISALDWLRLDESVQQFAVFMMSQVDLALEAAHLNRFIYNFRTWKDVSFPTPVYPLVHPAVLVETFEDGESVSHYVDEVKGNDRVNSALAHIGANALLKMLLEDNFIHADMHPGNILVRVAQNKPARKKLFKTKPHVIFIDVGMTAELSKNDRVNLLEFFKAVARRDGRTAAECTLRLSKKQNCPKPEAFIQEVKESFDFWGTPEGDFVHPAECMQQLLEQVRRHKVNVDGNVCTVMVTLLVLEGWQRKLDPDYDIMHTLQKQLLKADWAKSISYTIEGLMGP